MQLFKKEKLLHKQRIILAKYFFATKRFSFISTRADKKAQLTFSTEGNHVLYLLLYRIVFFLTVKKKHFVNLNEKRTSSSAVWSPIEGKMNFLGTGVSSTGNEAKQKIKNKFLHEASLKVPDFTMSVYGSACNYLFFHL